MSLIEFVSSRVKDAERENLKRAREKILAEAEEKYKIKEAKAERCRQRDAHWNGMSFTTKINRLVWRITMSRLWMKYLLIISLLLCDFYLYKIINVKVSLHSAEIWIPNKHYSGVYGLLKLIFPDLLSQDKVLALDTDITVLADISLL
ncbi:hypothetical protein HCN44_003495 [Aphidius gifuensis]|uniref:Uncharacterized protein n=1 Tax=Aphidius gifuensis TaxID=684658 RepID=A0A835CKW3_APHGI|nr:hypothetical protein HCN44_003495 [Aphidius gifuensis]